MQNYTGKAVHIVSEFEGFSSVPYNCPAGKPTIGFGHCILPSEAGSLKEITNVQAEQLLAKDLEVADQCITKYVKVPLNDNQRAALLSFIFNVGCGAFAASTMLKLINSGSMSFAASEFRRWVHCGPDVLPGLVIRREAEKELFLTPDN